MARAALAALGTSVFSEMTALANAHGAVNLSQGFPDFEGPAAIVDDAVAALRGGQNQYGRSMGLPPLVQAIADHQRRRYGQHVDAMTEVMATAGATEALAASFLGLLEPGDEVVLFEPFYDAYPALIAMAGAVPKVLTLRAPSFRLPVDELAAAITPRTRMVVVTSPHNPTGRVFDDEERAGLAAVCAKHGLTLLADEVYEHLTFERVHRPLAMTPGLEDRTLTISSTGKTFSYTGWKVGWAAGPAPLITAAQRAHQFLTFCGATPLHAAMAHALNRLDDAFVAELQADYRRRRDFVVDMLGEVGFDVLVPEGSYFCLATFDRLGAGQDDVSFARRLVTEAGVAAIPPSAFYSVDVPEGQRLLRFAFCKRDETLQAARRRLQAWRARLTAS